jgi:hypothetical protein
VVRSLSVLRILLGPIVLLHLEHFFRDAADGVVYSDHYWFPYVGWYPEASPGLYKVLLFAVLVTAPAMSLGIATRLTASYTAGFVAYNLFLSKHHFAHNRAFLVILLTLVAVVPTGRHLSIDALVGRHAHRRVPLWPLWLARFEVCAVYLASATSKLVDPDWWGGVVLQRRAIDNRALAVRQGAPEWAMDLLGNATVQWWLSKGAVLTEYVIALGFLNRRTRLFAIWVAIPFHLAIQAFARVQVFSWAALAALCLWATPDDRARTLVVPPHDAAFGRVVRRLDWFGRFEIHEAVHADTLTLEDRDGITRTGGDARLTTLTRLPVTFWFTAPALAWTRVRSRHVRTGR